MMNTIFGGTTATPIPISKVDQTYNPESENAQSGKAVAQAIGDIESALDSIIAIQNSLIGGGAE